MGQLTRNEVFTLAVQKYSDAVYRAAIHNSRCTADAEDVVQDVYEKLLHYNGTFESEEHLKAWLLRVAINRCRDLTRAAHQKDTELDENLPAPDAFEDGSVLDAVRALPENYRNAIYLHYYEGYTAAELFACRCFSVTRLDIRTRAALICGGDSFRHLLCVEGEGAVIHGGVRYPLRQGDSYFLPAALGECAVEGACRVLLSRV